MASRGVTLVLRTLWFNRSSWILVKEITAIRVYDYRAFTSRISGFRPLIKVPKSCFSDQSTAWLDKRSNLVWYSCIVESFLESLPRETSMGVLKPIEPLNSISLEVDDSNLHPCSIGGSVEPKIAVHARDPSDRVFFFLSREVNLHA
ncbi:hypothetical protein GW17_00035290 [Ensete ventricosum]|nr:hypothetical protein GW17_00035290 [Ensete ventricosum]